ncbi:MAG: phosphoribosyl-ATP diphosphatase, partial [Paenibacillus sp. RIFOXYA1_FULL_44_5]
TLLVQVEQTGPACHTGSYSCFYQSVGEQEEAGGKSADRFELLNQLEEIIAKRDAERPEGAYTTYLFTKGIDKILKKIGEEAGEVIIAAKNHNHEELRYEVSDLIFHVMVLLRDAKLPLDDILQELGRRYGKSKADYGQPD